LLLVRISNSIYACTNFNTTHLTIPASSILLVGKFFGYNAAIFALKFVPDKQFAVFETTCGEEKIPRRELFCQLCGFITFYRARTKSRPNKFRETFWVSGKRNFFALENSFVLWALCNKKPRIVRMRVFRDAASLMALSYVG